MNTVAAASSQTGQTGDDVRRPPAEPDQSERHEQVDEPRVDERHAREDQAVVEVPERDGEREQREQVEIAQRERPAQVGQADEEDGAEEEPDRHELIFFPPNAPDCPRAIAHATCGPVHASVTAPVRSSTRPVAISPAGPDQTFTFHCACQVVEVALGDEALLRVAADPVVHLPGGEEERDGARLRALSASPASASKGTARARA